MHQPAQINQETFAQPAAANPAMRFVDIWASTSTLTCGKKNETKPSDMLKGFQLPVILHKMERLERLESEESEEGKPMKVPDAEVLVLFDSLQLETSRDI